MKMKMKGRKGRPQCPGCVVRRRLVDNTARDLPALRASVVQGGGKEKEERKNRSDTKEKAGKEERWKYNHSCERARKIRGRNGIKN